MLAKIAQLPRPIHSNIKLDYKQKTFVALSVKGVPKK
jgi:hypothetical protein